MEEDKPKQHKVNEKLKKKRDKLKEHKKSKKEKRQAYDREDHRQKYFEQEKHKKIKKESRKKKKDQYGIKVHKLKSVISQFTKIYEGNIDQFYDIWKQLDEGKSIDFDSLQDPHIIKCLKKMCKYLLLHKQETEYTKPSSSSCNLQSYMKQKTEQLMEEYLKNGTASEGSDQSEPDSHQKVDGLQLDQEERLLKEQKKKLKQQQKQQIEQVEQQQHPMDQYLNQFGEYCPQQTNVNNNIGMNDATLNFKRLNELRNRLDRPSDEEEEGNRSEKQVEVNPNKPVVGPSIPPEQRQMIEKMFQQTVKNYEQEKIAQEQEEEAIDKMFGYKPQIKIQQKVVRSPYEMTPEEASKLMYRYSKAYRNRTLIQQYKERMIKLGKFKPGGVSKKPDNKRGSRGGHQQQSYQRDPSDLARIEAKRIDDMAKNNMFFNIKDRMSKPSVSSSFL